MTNDIHIGFLREDENGNPELIAAIDFSSNSAGEFLLIASVGLVANEVVVNVGSVQFRAIGDPFLSYEVSLENITDEPLDLFLFTIIDIDPPAIGLPVTSALEVEAFDPDGSGGMNVTVSHRAFLQGDVELVPANLILPAGLVITSPGTSMDSSGPVALVPPLPFTGTFYSRLAASLDVTNLVTVHGLEDDYNMLRQHSSETTRNNKRRRRQHTICCVFTGLLSQFSRTP